MAQNNKKQVEQITDMEVDFAQWYTDVCKKAELIDYSSIKGVFIYRPYGYAIWENIQAELDKRFKATGHENVYLPMLIPDETYAEIWSQVCADNGTTPDEASTLSEAAYQELDAEYALRMIEKVEQVMPQATYGQDQSVMLQLKLDGDYYSLVSSGWTTLDDMVLDYTGDYM